jgi:competence protein ComEA
MPTPSEQKALAFVAMVVLLGGAVRVVRGGILSPAAPTMVEQQALARQAYAANSSAVAKPASKPGKSRKGRRVSREGGDSGAISPGNGATRAQQDPRGFPPPGPRIDVSAAVTPMGVGAVPASHGRPMTAAAPIDLDTATEAEIERLPRIGPALAHRLVANRDSAGPFGGLKGLRRVPGLGAATLALLAPLVTFSGQARR